MSNPAVSNKLTAKAAILALLKRIHFYIGLFVGPFIFVAALTGTLYVLTPQLESHLYAHELYTSSVGDVQPLSRQIEAAQTIVGSNVKIYAVRPSPAQGQTTRVMFSEPALGESKSRAVFVDPVTLKTLGELTVYGTSGILPFRTWLDELHRGLLLGNLGRNYSELAASWLWVAALGGVVLWATGRKKVRSNLKLRGVAAKQHNSRRWHSWMGLTLIAGLLFLSVTGLTWSQWAGDNISLLRTQMGWMTPSPSTNLVADAQALPVDEHAGHRAADHSSMNMADMPEMNMAKKQPEHAAAVATVLPVTFDQVVNVARHAGIDAAKIEVRPAYSAEKAWTVTEVDRSWPTRVDAVSVNPRTLVIIDHTRFANFPLLAKLTRWGVDAHMGILFGLWNQIVLVAFGLGLCTMIGWGYRLWWLRRPQMNSASNPGLTLMHTWRRMPFILQFPITLVVIGLSFSLPLMGISLVIFLLIDIVRWKKQQSSLTPASSLN
ncbi:PepSY-associated TM helix domain-containing protein [Ewingella sp. S1.OA.A_B6]